jgi:predicted NBD/HSP70 family sugar kinase
MGLYVGIDIHRKFSQVCVMDEAGQVVGKTRLDHADPERITDFFEGRPVRPW